MTTAALPDFEALSACFPKGVDEEVRRSIGGAAASDAAADVSCLRLSRAFNEAKHPIPEGYKLAKGGTLATALGADGKHYALRLAEFALYLREKFGEPDVSFGGGGASPAVIGLRGIMVFAVAGQGGFLDLWNGSQCACGDRFASATSVELWTSKEDALRKEANVKVWEMNFRGWTEAADGGHP